MENELREARIEIVRLRKNSARLIDEARYEAGEEARALAAELAELTGRLRVAEQEAHQVRVQLRDLRASSSWRLTRPIRMLGRRATGSRPGGSAD